MPITRPNASFLVPLATRPVTSVVLGSFFSKPRRSCRISTYSFVIRTNLERNTAALFYVIPSHYVKFSPSIRHSPSILSIGLLDQLLSGRPSLGVRPYYTLVHVIHKTHVVFGGRNASSTRKFVCQVSRLKGRSGTKSILAHVSQFCAILSLQLLRRESRMAHVNE